MEKVGLRIGLGRFTYSFADVLCFLVVLIYLHGADYIDTVLIYTTNFLGTLGYTQVTNINGLASNYNTVLILAPTT